MTAPTYRLEEITRLADVSRRALRYYIQRGLLPGPEPRGIATVYTHEQLVRLRAIVLLRRRDRLRLDQVKRRLQSMALAEIEALVAPPAPPASPAPPPSPAPAPAATSATRAVGQVPCVRWDHVELLPGLELRVRSDAGPLLRRLVQEIYAQYTATPAADAPSTDAPPESGRGINPRSTGTSG
jgi:DNA-binding transcriptional MerR regulator